MSYRGDPQTLLGAIGQTVDTVRQLSRGNTGVKQQNVRIGDQLIEDGPADNTLVVTDLGTGESFTLPQTIPDPPIPPTYPIKTVATDTLGAGTTVFNTLLSGTASVIVGENVFTAALTADGNADSNNVVVGSNTATNALASFDRNVIVGSSILNTGSSGAINQSVIVGHNAQNVGSVATLGCVVVGADSTSSGDYTIVIGYNADHSGGYGVTIGAGAITGGYGTAVGIAASSTGFGTVSIGAYSLANASEAVAIGPNAQVNTGALSGVAVGTGAGLGANAEFAVAVGPYAQISANTIYGIAIGFQATTNISSAIAIGRQALVQNTGSGGVSNAIGYFARVHNATGFTGNVYGGLAIGTNAQIVPPRTVGGNAQESIAIGNSSRASQIESVVIGVNANTGPVAPATPSSLGAVVVGHGATSASGVVIGTSATGTSASPSGVAIGYAASWSAPAAIAMGNNATASGDYAIAFGSGASASGTNSISFNGTVSANYRAQMNQIRELYLVGGFPGTDETTLVLQSPDGTAWRISISNAGVLSVAPA